VPTVLIIQGLLPLIALAMFVAVASTACMLATNPLLAWVSASAITIAASRVVALPVNAPVWIAIALGAALLLTGNANSRMAYLSGERT
jgi:hypothetical protein